MHWLLEFPRHQQPRYSSYWMNGHFSRVEIVQLLMQSQCWATVENARIYFSKNRRDNDLFDANVYLHMCHVWPWSSRIRLQKRLHKTLFVYIESLLPKGPYPPCLRMADRALLAGYPRYLVEALVIILCGQRAAGLGWCYRRDSLMINWISPSTTRYQFKRKAIIHITLI